MIWTPSDLAFSLAAQSEARSAKRRHCATLISSVSPSLARNSSTSATASPYVSRPASSSQASRKREATGSNAASTVRRFSRHAAAFSAARAARPLRSSQALRGPVLLVAQRVEQVAVELADPEIVEALHQRQVAALVRREADVGGAEDERLVALVAAAVEQRRRLGVGAGDDDAGNLHDVELEARRVQALDLLVLRDQDLAALVAALLGPRALVFDVVPGHADFDEAPDEVAHVRVAAVAGVGVGDDERAKVHGRRRGCAASRSCARADTAGCGRR